MKTTETITYASIAVIAISLFFIGTELTGFALTDTGLVNVTIDTSASIVFETSLLDFGNGTITPGQVAIISSNGTDIEWSGATAGMTGLILENNGNINVTIELNANTDADGFIGGASPEFKMMVTNNETGSCATIVSAFDGVYEHMNTTLQTVCSGTGLGSLPGQDSIRIDAELTMDDNAAGAKTTTITATATSI